MAAISKLEPHRSIYLRGFDRRGAAAAMTNASAGGFTVSGCWSDQADFAVCVLFDADDQFGHLYTSRYLPDFSLAGVTLDFDLTLIGCQSPASQKYQSVPWGSLSYITRTVSGGAVTEIQGSVSLLGGGRRHVRDGNGYAVGHSRYRRQAVHLLSREHGVRHRDWAVVLGCDWRQRGGCGR
jgi:hypothetical protein